MADYSACFYDKFLLKKLLFFGEINETMLVNVLCAHEFSWFAKKVVCTTYDVLGISAFISGVIFGENIYIFFSNLKWNTFLHILIQKLYWKNE